MLITERNNSNQELLNASPSGFLSSYKENYIAASV